MALAGFWVAHGPTDWSFLHNEGLPLFLHNCNVVEKYFRKQENVAVKLLEGVKKIPSTCSLFITIPMRRKNIYFKNAYCR